MMLRSHHGYTGVFTTAQHQRAKYQNGTRVEKVWSEPGDVHPTGSRGVVLGSVGHKDVGVGYFVEWDAHPKHAVFVIERKLGVHG